MLHLLLLDYVCEPHGKHRLMPIAQSVPLSSDSLIRDS